jgi:hypothetical protein
LEKKLIKIKKKKTKLKKRSRIIIFLTKNEVGGFMSNSHNCPPHHIPCAPYQTAPTSPATPPSHLSQAEGIP